MRRASVVIQQSLESEKDVLKKGHLAALDEARNAENARMAEERRRHEADKERLVEEKRQEIIKMESHHRDVVEQVAVAPPHRAEGG
mmetsp:Transcript_27605/g.38541  ORF Transcript_27605/g.38541 Transcript_27605/m.38541 type:complete len:86 (+) Transcript_27605:62-319(+)